MKENIVKILKEKKISKAEGWKEGDILFFEENFLEGKKYPEAIRAYLEIAGNVIDVTRFYCLKDFYDKRFSQGSFLDGEIQKWLISKDYCIVGYYAEGGYVWFSLLNGEKNPPVYMNEEIVDYDELGKPNFTMSFKKIADCFTDFLRIMINPG